MNHRMVGSVSMVILWVSPVLAYLTTHRLCDFHQFCPGSNVKVTAGTEAQTIILLQCSDQITESYAKHIVFSVLAINGFIIIGHLYQRSHLGRKMRRLARQPSCRVGPGLEDTEAPTSSRPQLRLQNKIPHHVTFNSGLISILIPTLGTGVALFILSALEISIFE